jgi:hypothetical protein
VTGRCARSHNEGVTGNWIPEMGVGPVPRGWQAVRRFDRETGEPVILMRKRPLRRYLLSLAAIGGVVFLWAFALTARRADDGFFVPMVLMASSGTLGTIVLTLTQDGFTVTPGRLRCGRVWVASGNWRGNTADAAELVLQREEVADIAKMHLYATHPGGGRDEIFADDDEYGRAARPFAEWLSAVAHIPVTVSRAG